MTIKDIRLIWQEIEHIKGRVADVEAYPENCVALNLCKSTHNNQLWYNSQLKLMMSKITEILEMVNYVKNKIKT